MFPASSLNDLLGEGVYGFSEREAVYLAAVKFCDDIFDSEWRLAERDSYTPEQVSHIFWWVMNEAWDVYCQVNANLPIAWLSITKKALEWDHVPINFHPWALAILEHFDLERYHAAYHLPRDEYEAIAHDLPVVLEGLRNYPAEKLAAPIDEDNWGYMDY